jgi:hypothetical protein
MNTNNNPYESPTTSDKDLLSDATQIAIIEPLLRSAGWTKFIGIMFIIAGAFSALSIWGIIFAWVPIWMGVLLIKHTRLLREASQAGDVEKCKESLDRLRLFFKIFGILMIMYASIIPLAIIAAIAIPNLLASRQ